MIAPDTTRFPSKAPWLIIGAGPAGLTAAFTLAERKCQPLVLEASRYIGGISRTHLWDGNRLDIGGHRFFTKSHEVKRLWAAMLDEPMLKVNRLSRIFYGGRFFQYPLQVGNTLANLGIYESSMMVASYLRARANPTLPEETFEQWVRNGFGDRLYRTFFKTYTEKVWVLPCSEICADWAAQRIQGLSFTTAVINALRNSGRVKSLIKTFDYPRLGPGMLWESCAGKITGMGGTVATGQSVTRLHHAAGTISRVTINSDEGESTVAVERVISTMPLSTLVKALDPPPPAAILAAADGLKYRDFLIVALACRKPDIFPDNWIYIHSPDVRVGRIQNFRNWSPDMVAAENGTTLGMEYFCSRGDVVWSMSDGDLIAMAKQEAVALGLVQEEDLTTGHVVRELNAYPVYDAAYRKNLDVLRDYLANFSNLQTAGRNGLHRYNNQDHSMLAGQHAALKLLGRDDLDPWEVNTERSYYEEQLVSQDPAHTPRDILASDITPPHENV